MGKGGALESVAVPRRALSRIRRETDDVDAVGRLVAEAWLRRWLLAAGVPCWTAPAVPGRGPRYGLILASGARIMVEPGISPGTWDRTVESCCSVVAVVEPVPAEGEAVFHGWLTLPGLQAYGTGCGLNPPCRLPAALGVPRSFHAAYIYGCIRLFIAGEPPPPKKGLEGVSLYTRRRPLFNGKRVQ